MSEPDSLQTVIRPHNERDSMDFSISNLDEDDGLLVNIRFTELVRVKEILLSSHGEERPGYWSVTDSVSRAQRLPFDSRIWANTDVSFDDVNDLRSDQEFDVMDAHDCQDYPLRVARLSVLCPLMRQALMCSRSASVSNMTLFFVCPFRYGCEIYLTSKQPLRRHASTVRLYYLGFKGVSRVYKKVSQPIIIRDCADLATGTRRNALSW